MADILSFPSILEAISTTPPDAAARAELEALQRVHEVELPTVGLALVDGHDVAVAPS